MNYCTALYLQRALSTLQILYKSISTTDSKVGVGGWGEGADQDPHRITSHASFII